MRVKRGSACIHLLRIRHVERTQFSPHRYSHSHIHTAKSVKFGFYFHLFFFLLSHLSSEFVPTLFAIWLSGSGHNSNAWILCAVVCSCKLHGTHTHGTINSTVCLRAFFSSPLPVQPYVVLIVRKRKQRSPKKGILLLLAIGFSLCACVCKCAGVCVCVSMCEPLYVLVYVCVWARLRKAICHALPVKLNAVEHF